MTGTPVLLGQCAVCMMIFESTAEYRYADAARTTTVCRNQRRCRSRRGHTYRPSRIYTQDGMLVRCRYHRCGYESHRIQAALS